jgi:hypothetical protein
VLTAVRAFSASSDPDNWRTNRVRTAALLIFGSAHWQVQR